MSTKWQAVRCLEDNAPDYWIVTTRPIYQAPVIARCDTQESAETIAVALNSNADLLAAVQEVLSTPCPEIIYRWLEVHGLTDKLQAARDKATGQQHPQP